MSSANQRRIWDWAPLTWQHPGKGPAFACLRRPAAAALGCCRPMEASSHGLFLKSLNGDRLGEDMDKNPQITGDIIYVYILHITNICIYIIIYIRHYQISYTYTCNLHTVDIWLCKHQFSFCTLITLLQQKASGIGPSWAAGAGIHCERSTWRVLGVDSRFSGRHMVVWYNIINIHIYKYHIHT